MTEDQRLDLEHAIRFGIEQAIDHALVHDWLTPENADRVVAGILRRFAERMEPAK
jgi:hypothetical protein